MKFLAIVCGGLMVAAAAATAAASAAEREPRHSQRGQPPALAPQSGTGQATMPQREMRGMRGIDAGDLRRMSPDERRQLRRDIQDAGKDIYRPAQQGPSERRRAERR